MAAIKNFLKIKKLCALYVSQIDMNMNAIFDFGFW